MVSGPDLERDLSQHLRAAVPEIQGTGGDERLVVFRAGGRGHLTLPSTRCTVRSAARATAVECVTTSVAPTDGRIRRSRSSRDDSSAELTSAVGSSASSSRGPPASATARFARAVSPPDRVEGRAWARSARPSASSSSRWSVVLVRDPRERGGQPQVLEHVEMLEEPAGLGQNADQPSAQPGLDVGGLVAEPSVRTRRRVVEPGSR